MARNRQKKPRLPTTVRTGVSGETLYKYVTEHEHRIKIIIGPLGSGKTTATIQLIFDRIVTQKPDKNGERRSRWVAIRNTYPDLETTTIPDFREVFTDDFGTFKMSNPPTFQFDFPMADNTRVVGEVFFLALDQPEDIKKLRGTQLTGGWLNEGKEIPKEILDMLDSRIGRYPKKADLGRFWHGILSDTNAPDEDHWMAEVEENTPLGWKVYMQPGGVNWINGQWVPNPLAENVVNLPDNYYQNIIQGKRKDWIQVNVENRFGLVKDGKPVHPDFSREFHVSRTPLPIEPNATVLVGIDFGRTPAAVMGQLVNDQWRILREYVTEDMGALKFGGLLRTFVNKHFASCKNIEFWGDPSGDSPGQNDDETPISMLAVNNIECYPCHTNVFSIRIAVLDNLLTQVNEGQPRIVVDPSCKSLIRGLNGGYRFKRLRVSGESRYKDAPDKDMHSHVCEASHYMLLGGGEEESVIGTIDNGEFDSVESDPDFDGWHPQFTGTDRL